MKWSKERDDLIAQTKAFVQSVTGRRPLVAPEQISIGQVSIGPVSVRKSRLRLFRLGPPQSKILLQSLSQIPSRTPSRSKISSRPNRSRGSNKAATCRRHLFKARSGRKSRPGSRPFRRTSTASIGSATPITIRCWQKPARISKTAPTFRRLDDIPILKF
jgi:hypothetical protein